MKTLLSLTMLFLLIANLTSQTLQSYAFDIAIDQGSKQIKKSDERFIFQGTTSVNTTEQLTSSLQGSQQFRFTAILSPQGSEGDAEGKLFRECGVNVSVGMNVLNLKPTGVASDSFDLVSLMFPETGNFGLMVSPTLNYLYKNDGNGRHRLSSEISFSLRQNKVNNIFLTSTMGDTLSGPETVEFSILNFNVMPVRYDYSYLTDDFRFDLSVGLYFNIFNVPNEDAASFNKLYPDDKPLFESTDNSYIQSIGAKLSCTINGFLIFADLRQNIKTKHFLDSNPYKGFVFNTGIAQNLSIFKK
jgi:hypothetical protein